ncbi:MAG: RNA repair domain-containing protein, partial [Pseudomonadota bacterium]
SRARVAEFHRWLPHVLTDQHESRHDSYFFQPGVPSRQNPLTPPGNLELTRKLAQYHADAMDAAGEMYFTEDTYDDFYFGKGSSYPDINGTIGILFEQPNVKGPVLERGNRPLTFQNAISNHLTTTLSTLRGSVAHGDELKAYQQEFFGLMSERAGSAGFTAWVMGDDGDPARAAELLKVFEQHSVEFQPLGNLHMEKGNHFSFTICMEGEELTIPFHRIREVRKNGKCIWKR